MERSKSRRGQACLTGFALPRGPQASRLLTCLLCVVCLICVLCIVGACAPHSRKAGAPLPRANPGYVQWLERQSMLSAVPQYTRMVSGTELSWRIPTTDDSGARITTLLEAADTWLFVQPELLLTERQRPVLAELGDPATLRLIQQLGFGGLYLTPTAESAALWSGQRQGSLSAPGEDISSLNFAAHVGTDKLFGELAQSAGQYLQFGSGLVPAAVGIGPDFFLAARNVREYPGTLMMVEVPKELWKLLPPAAPLAPSQLPIRGQAAGPNKAATLPASSATRQSENMSPRWTGTALEGPHSASFAALVEKNLVPSALLRDSIPWATHGAWAATPIIEGIDGVERRFVYRYHGDVQRPLLQWDDPSKNAQRILSASIIRTIGNQQQTLGGLYPEAWFGLDSVAPASTAGQSSDAARARLAEPTASALRALSREIQRYGGWAMQAEVFPPSLTAAILRTGVDFTVDSVTSPGAEYALLTGDTQILKQNLKNSLNAGIDQRRLVRGLPHYKGLNLRPLLDSPQGAAARTALEARLATKTAAAWALPLHDNILYATATTLAALAAQLNPEEALRPEALAAVRSRHLLLTTFRAGMPGLLLLSGQDLTGALNLPATPVRSGDISGGDTQKGTAQTNATPSGTIPSDPIQTGTTPAGSTLGAWAFSAPSAAAFATRSGQAKAPSLYGPVAVQATAADSYARQVAALTSLRKQWAVARASLSAVPDTNYTTSVALLLQTPAGTRILNVANFSDQARTESISLPAGGSARKVTDLLSPGQSVQVQGQSVRLDLDPWQCRLIHIE